MTEGPQPRPAAGSVQAPREDAAGRAGKVGLLIGSCVAAAVLAALAGELYLRLTQTRIVVPPGATIPSAAFASPGLLIDYTPRGRRLVPGADVVIARHYLSGRDVPMRINSRGFRDGELAVPKPQEETRILVLGDSITWGDYLPAEEVYVERAEAELRRRHPERRIEVVNGGVGDIGLREQVDILRERGLDLEPDVAVVAFYLNDSRPPWGFPAELGAPGWLRRRSLLARRIHQHLALRRWVRRQGAERFAWIPAAGRLDWRHDRGAFLELAGMAKFDWGAAWQPESWAVVGEQLTRLQALARERSFSVALMALPAAYQIEADFLEDEPQRKLARLAADLGFPCLDILPELRRRAAPGMYFDHCHPTAPTNALMGQLLAAFLDERFLRDRDERTARP